MKAVAVFAVGEVPALIDVPITRAPGAGEVQLQVTAAGLNPRDWKQAAGLFGPLGELPFILGRDVAGTVAAVGEGVSIEPGARVCGWAAGAYAERAVTSSDLLGIVPDGVDLEVAAAVPTPGVTASQLCAKAREAGARTVLIVGATGSVGTFATQLLASSNIEVIATARPANAELMKSLGATHVIDYSAGPVVEQVLGVCPAGVDLLIDLISGPSDFSEMLRVVRQGGGAVSTIGAADPKNIADREVAGENFVLTPDPRALESLLQRIDHNDLTVVARSGVPLAKAADALAANREGRTTGKTVLIV